MSDGARTSAQRTVTISVRAPVAVRRQIDHLAHLAGLSTSQFLRLVLARLGPEDVPSALAASRSELQAARTAR
jgi:hypothetical protein